MSASRKPVRTFEWKGKTYEISVEREGLTTSVLVHSEGKLIVRNSVKFETEISYRHVIGEDPVYGKGGLIELSEQDVKALPD
jgi:hypothetical protein